MKLLRIFNRQKTRPVNALFLRQITTCLLGELFEINDYELAVHLVEPGEMTQVNQNFLGHEGSTDVITFDNSENDSGALCGEIFISVNDAIEYARMFRSSWQSEVVRYVVHGVLHLRGYDDLEPALKRVMKRQENRVVKAIAGRFELAGLERLPGVKRGRGVFRKRSQ